MQKLLTKRIGKKTLKSDSFGPLFLDYDIPDTWQVLTLKECVRSDVPITYGIVQAGPHIPSGVPNIRTGDMSGGKLSKDDMVCTSKEIASDFRRSQVKAGEIVSALRGIVGMVLKVPEDLEGANLTQGTARISPRQDIYPRYLLWALRSKYARRIATASVQLIISYAFSELELEEISISIFLLWALNLQSLLLLALAGEETVKNRRMNDAIIIGIPILRCASAVNFILRGYLAICFSELGSKML